MAGLEVFFSPIIRSFDINEVDMKQKGDSQTSEYSKEEKPYILGDDNRICKKIIN